MKLFKTLFDLVSLPVEIVKDIITLGNVGDMDGKGSYTKRKVKELDEDLEN